MFETIQTAVEQFWDFLSDIAILPLLAAIGCHLLKLACTSRAWRNVLAAAYPDDPVPLAADPRGLRLGCRRQRDRPGPRRRRRAHLPRPPRDPGQLVHDGRRVDRRPHVRRHGARARRVRLGAHAGRAPVVRRALGAAGVRLLLGVRRRGHPPRRRDRPGRDRGAAAPGSSTTSGTGCASASHRRSRSSSRPSRYARTVVPWQLADWGLRLATIWFFLGAFGIHQSIGNVLLVQAAMSLATLVPATPGGIGTEQAFLVYAFRDAACAVDAARVQRRHEADAHRRQRRRRLHRDLPHARDGPLPPGASSRRPTRRRRSRWLAAPRLVQLGVDGARRLRGEPGNALQLLLRGLRRTAPPSRSGAGSPAGGRPDPLQVVEDRLERARVAASTVEPDREPVRLVPSTLEKLQPRVVPRQAGSARLARARIPPPRASRARPPPPAAGRTSRGSPRAPPRAAPCRRRSRRGSGPSRSSRPSAPATPRRAAARSGATTTWPIAAKSSWPSRPRMANVR